MHIPGMRTKRDMLDECRFLRREMLAHPENFRLQKMAYERLRLLRETLAVWRENETELRRERRTA